MQSNEEEEKPLYTPSFSSFLFFFCFGVLQRVEFFSQAHVHSNTFLGLQDCQTRIIRRSCFG